MGFIHYNNTVEEQVQHVKRAKNHTPGFVVEPAVMRKDRTVLDLFDLKERKGYGSVCVTDTGDGREAAGGRELAGLRLCH